MMSAKKKQVRAAFRSSVFERDGHKCRVCGAVAPEGAEPDSHLDAHHITDRTEMPNGGYVKENGISLCAICHEKAEVYHSSGKATHEIGFLPADLYNLIGSSYEKALEASKRLGA